MTRCSSGGIGDTVKIAQWALGAREFEVNAGKNNSSSPLSRPRLASACICCEGLDIRSSPAILMPFVADRVFGWKPVTIDKSWGLKTIEPGNAYSICNTLECNRCGCLFLDIRFCDDELARLYNGYREQEYVTLRNIYEPGYAARNENLLSGIDYLPTIEGFLSPFLQRIDSVLDWGGDTGKNTPFRSARTRHVYDISPRQVVPGVEFVSLETAWAGRYDLVVCSNVLEHVPFPEKVLHDVRETLGPQTVLYIEVPKEKIFDLHPPPRCHNKKHWHEHVNFFSKNSLIALVSRCGLEVIGISEFQVAIGNDSFSAYQVACRLAKPRP